MAFTAAATSASSTWNSGTLVSNVVISNVGNGYNKSAGVFTAPFPGTYVFYVSANEYSAQGLGLDIVLNNVPKARLLASNSASNQTGTNVVVLVLQKGDKVWVNHFHGKGFWTQTVSLTTFTGFRI